MVVIRISEGEVIDEWGRVPRYAMESRDHAIVSILMRKSKVVSDRYFGDTIGETCEAICRFYGKKHWSVELDQSNFDRIYKFY